MNKEVTGMLIHIYVVINIFPRLEVLLSPAQSCYNILDFLSTILHRIYTIEFDFLIYKNISIYNIYNFVPLTVKNFKVCSSYEIMKIRKPHRKTKIMCIEPSC